MLRGAKKKGKVDTGSTEPESNDIINIFKDKTDPVKHTNQLYFNFERK